MILTSVLLPTQEHITLIFEFIQGIDPRDDLPHALKASPDGRISPR